jgi:hypothetical protein
MANRPHHHAIAPKSLRKPIPSYHVKTGRNGISGTAVSKGQSKLILQLAKE